MENKIEKELKDVRRNLELEIEQGTFPDVDLDEVIDTLRRGIIQIKEGKGISMEEGLKRINSMGRGVCNNV